MATSKFKDPKFHNEDAARAWFEATRWQNGPVCPHCKGAKHYAIKKAGRYRCAAKDCRKDFTVMTGTVMERSHAPLTSWAIGFHMAASSKKGISAHQLHRELGCEYNTAWFMWHRIREAMGRGGLEIAPLGGAGKVVEVDETYLGGLPEHKRSEAKRTGRKWHRTSQGVGTKRAILSLVERGGEARSFYVENAPIEAVVKIVRENVSKESRLHSDESYLYKKVGKEFGAHETVVHSRKEYARGDVTTNTVEGFFGVFKRGMKGVYQHCDEKHLHRYLAEFVFRYKHRASLGYSDEDRAVAAVKSGEGKRLTYRPAH